MLARTCYKTVLSRLAMFPAVVLLGPRQVGKKWAIAIKSGSTPKPTRGFYHALDDVAPDKTFVVYACDERYPLSEGIDALGLSEVMGLIGEQN